MSTWTIEEPRKLTFDTVRQLRVRTFRGSLSVVGTDQESRLEVTDIRGDPPTVRLEDGGLEVGYDDWSRPGFLSWLLGRRKWRRHAVVSVAVPRACPVDLGVVSAGVVVSGLRAPVTVRVVSGDITLAGLTGPVDAETVSGSVEAHAVTGRLRMHTVSGDLTLIEGGGEVHARTISGTVTCDVAAAGSGGSDIGLSAVSGDVVVRMPDRSDLEVRLQASSGQISSAFGELQRSGVPGMQVVTGRLGAGTGRLRAATTSGHVTLLRRDREGPAGGEPRPPVAGEVRPGPGPGEGEAS
jgi:Putative adhesin